MHEDTTDFPNLTTTSPAALNAGSAPATAFGSIIRMTPMERAAGRLMRAPDHDEADTATVLTEGSENDDGGTDAEAKAKADAEAAVKADAEAKNKTDAEAKAKAEADAKAQNEFLGAPEGDYEITGLPEGVDVDKAVVDALAPVAREINLSNKAMSQLAGVYNDKVLPHLTDTITGQIENQVALTRKEWHQETQLAVEGGTDEDGKKIEPLKGEDGQPLYDGKTLKDVQQVAAKTLDRFGTPELRTFLEESGLGNHEAMVRFAYAVGKAISEDKFPRSAAKGKLTDAELFYGSSTT